MTGRGGVILGVLLAGVSALPSGASEAQGLVKSGDYQMVTRFYRDFCLSIPRPEDMERPVGAGGGIGRGPLPAAKDGVVKLECATNASGWTLREEMPGQYLIIAQGTPLRYLGTTPERTYDYNELKLTEGQPGNHQRWKLRRRSNLEEFWIVNVATGECLDGGRTGIEGVGVEQSPCKNHLQDIWEFHPINGRALASSTAANDTRKPTSIGGTP